MKIDKKFITTELIDEFISTHGETVPDPDIYPNQVWYQYQLFLLEKGLYGIKVESEEVELESTDSTVPD